jgi:hypothetical protein
MSDAEVGRHPGRLGVFFRRLAHKKNRNVAVVATARKLVTIAWQMLRTGEPYRYALPDTSESKLAKLRIGATTHAGRVASPGAPLVPLATAPAERSRYPRSTSSTAREQLPPPHPLTPAELRMLQDTATADFARDIRISHRIPRNRTRADSEQLTRS